MLSYHHHPDGWIILRRDGINVYLDTPSNFASDYGQAAPALPEGYREREYTPDVLHYARTASSEARQPMPWADGDAILAAVDSLVAAKAARLAPAPPTRQQAVDSKKAAINVERDRREQLGFDYLNKTFDSDPTSVQRIAIAVQAAQAAISAGQAFSLDWTCADNAVLAMTAEQVVGMSVALAQFSNGLHQHARLRKQAVDEALSLAATVEEIQAIEVW